MLQGWTMKSEDVEQATGFDTTTIFSSVITILLELSNSIARLNPPPLPGNGRTRNFIRLFKGVSFLVYRIIRSWSIHSVRSLKPIDIFSSLILFI